MNLIVYLRAINSSELFEIIYLTLQIIINIIVILKLENLNTFEKILLEINILKTI